MKLAFISIAAFGTLFTGCLDQSPTAANRATHASLLGSSGESHAPGGSTSASSGATTSSNGAGQAADYCPAALVSGKFNGKTTPDLEVISSSSAEASGLLMLTLQPTRVGEVFGGGAAICQADGVWKLGSWDSMYTSKAYGPDPFASSSPVVPGQGPCIAVPTEATTVEVMGSKFDIPAGVVTGAYKISTLSLFGKTLNGGAGVKNMCSDSGPAIRGEIPGSDYAADGAGLYRIFTLSAFKMATEGRCSTGEFYEKEIGGACMQKLSGKAGKIRGYWLTRYGYESLEAPTSKFAWKRVDGYSEGYYGNECFCAD